MTTPSEERIRRMIACGESSTMSYRGLGSGIIRAVNDGTPIDFVNDETGNELKAILWKTEKASSKSQSDQVKASSSEEKASSKSQSDQVKASSSEEKASSKPQSDQVKSQSKPQSDQVKSQSNDEKSQSKPQSDQVKSQSNDEKSQSKKAHRISKLLAYCVEPRTLAEIMELLNMSDKAVFKKNYINPLLGKSLKMTQPNSPKSPTQKYVVIDYPL